ncbi:hypothetical protein [Sorangium sp. So ce861]|uniref:hypothetical protein n=1 Tax=Sorangium sp. So ce861 TaxID=3133323 RepID=UPI003F6340A9
MVASAFSECVYRKRVLRNTVGHDRDPSTVTLVEHATDLVTQQPSAGERGTNPFACGIGRLDLAGGPVAVQKKGEAEQVRALDESSPRPREA